MNSGIFFPICALFVSVLLIVVFFSRKHMKTAETTLYSYLIVSNVVGLVIELCCTYASLIHNEHLLVSNFILKLYLVYLITWITLFVAYIFVISHNKDYLNGNKRKLTMSIVVYYLVSIFMVLLLPIELVVSDDFSVRYTTGFSVYFTYLHSLVSILIMVYCMIKNHKNLRSKKYLPVYSFYAIGAIAMAFQFSNPGLLLLTAVETYILLLMYFTIENPDMKLLEEVHKSKEISDAANEEKTLFLYNMTQEIRNTTNEIDDNADIILDSDSIETDKDCAREIKGITSKFRTMTNEMFDVSKLDSASIKVYNSKYNVKNILKEIVTMYSKTCSNKNIDFRVNIDRDVPEVLYGDSINVKEVLSIIMDNSVKYTKEGFIEFNVSTIIKNDVCRLIITVEDSGVGIKSDDINKIKIGDKSLSKANKLVTLMNGAMMVSSNYGIGTKVKVILDQKIEISVNEDIAKYSEIYDNIKILMVDDSEAGIKIIEKLIKGSNVKMDFATNGRECIDKIRAYNRYDVILLDEQLTQISANELLMKIKNIRNFDTPVILLTKDNSYEYNDEYKKLGFSDYILKPVKKDELIRKIDMCVKKDK